MPVSLDHLDNAERLLLTRCRRIIQSSMTTLRSDRLAIWLSYRFIPRSADPLPLPVSTLPSARIRNSELTTIQADPSQPDIIEESIDLYVWTTPVYPTLA